MRIALAQITTGPDPEANLALIEKYTARAAAAGARIVLFPEASMCAFGNRLDTIAENLEDSFASRVRRIAKEYAVGVVVGMFTPGRQASSSETHKNRVRNTLLATDGKGQEAAYTKIHLYDAFGFKESDTVDAGEAPVIWEFDGEKIGLALCYDIRFPALFQHYAQRGANLTLLSASWGAGPGKKEQWRLLSQARALDSTQFLAACGQALPAAASVTPASASAPTGVGHSMLISPTGEILDELSEAPGLLLADLDLPSTEETRKILPVLANARSL